MVKGPDTQLKMEKEMLNIILIGLPYEPNLGDQVIFFTMDNLIREVCRENGQPAEIHGIDLFGRAAWKDRRFYREIYYRPGNFPRRAAAAVCKVFHMEQMRRKIIDSIICESVDLQFSEITAKHKVDAVIVAGGGLIKYRYLKHLPRGIIQVIRRCEDMKIPVMISGVGIEDGASIARGDTRGKRLLLDALRSDVVKCITTRDDLDFLRTVAEQSDAVIARVADPACSVARFIPRDTEKKEGEGRRVGIGVPRYDLFKDNGIDLGGEKVVKLYADLYRELEKRGYECCFFSNGLVPDEDFIDRVESFMKRSDPSLQPERIPRQETVEGILKMISGFDGVIAARLHASIISYSYGIPAAAMVWNKKIPFFYERIGHPERAVRMNELDAETLVTRLEEAMAAGYNETVREEYCDSTKICLTGFMRDHVFKKGSANEEQS